MNPDIARAILKIKFDGATTKRIRHLLRKNSRDTISAAERLELESFLRVGKLIDILHTKARLYLRDLESGR